MKLLDQTFDEPLENLACDELLLRAAEERNESDLLRFWESTSYFVVLGYSRPLMADVDFDACHRNNIPIHRRASGGGTVLQGPGCLNYALILRTTPGSPLSSITGTTRTILRRNARALGPLVNASVIPMGDSDLTIHGRKFSGNAQRRTGKFVLFHGTLLLHFDIPLATATLRLPKKRPAYRNDRIHEEFMVNLGIDASTAKRALQEEWGARDTHPPVRRDELQELIRKRYGRKEWVVRL